MAQVATDGGELRDRTAWQDAKHTDITTISLIRPSLWDEAKWFGVVFITSAGDSDLPIIAPVFRDGSAARTSFGTGVATWAPSMRMSGSGCRLFVG